MRAMLFLSAWLALMLHASQSAQISETAWSEESSEALASFLLALNPSYKFATASAPIALESTRRHMLSRMDDDDDDEDDEVEDDDEDEDDEEEEEEEDPKKYIRLELPPGTPESVYPLLDEFQDYLELAPRELKKILKEPGVLQTILNAASIEPLTKELEPLKKDTGMTIDQLRTVVLGSPYLLNLKYEETGPSWKGMVEKYGLSQFQYIKMMTSKPGVLAWGLPKDIQKKMSLSSQRKMKLRNYEKGLKAKGRKEIKAYLPESEAIKTWQAGLDGAEIIEGAIIKETEEEFEEEFA